MTLSTTARGEPSRRICSTILKDRGRGVRGRGREERGREEERGMVSYDKKGYKIPERKVIETAGKTVEVGGEDFFVGGLPIFIHQFSRLDGGEVEPIIVITIFVRC